VPADLFIPSGSGHFALAATLEVALTSPIQQHYRRSRQSEVSRGTEETGAMAPGFLVQCAFPAQRLIERNLTTGLVLGGARVFYVIGTIFKRYSLYGTEHSSVL
jgi:hypothetical protein